MPSTPLQPPPTVTAKPRGIFPLRRKVAEFVNGSQSKIGSKLSTSIGKSKNNANRVGPVAETNTTSTTTATTTATTTTAKPSDQTNVQSTIIINMETHPTESTTINPTATLLSPSTITDTGDGSNNGYNTNTITNTTTIGNTINSSDGNNNSLPVQPPLSNKMQTSNETKSTFATISDQNNCSSNSSSSSFSSSESRTTNEESCCNTTSQATLFTTTSTTSSHRQRIERQITCTSEVKTSCVKSDLSELKSFSEIHNLHFDNASKFRKASIDNILDGKETITTRCDNVNGNGGGSGGVYSNGVYCRNISVTGEPLITYPESPAPSSLNASLTNFPCEVVAGSGGSRKSSNASVIDDLHCGGFERRLSSASKAKLLTEQFIGGEMVASATGESSDFNRQNSTAKTSPISERSLDTQNEQRKLSSENVTHQQSQNVCSSSTIKLQADSFSAEEKFQKASTAQQQMVTSIGCNFQSAKGFSNSLSQSKQNTSNFIANETSETKSMGWQATVADHLNESFDDLTDLLVQTNSSQQDVDNVISKYSCRVKDVFEALANKKSKINATAVLDKLSDMMTKAWLVPNHGHQLGNSLCDTLRECNGLKLLISNCDSKDSAVKFSSIRLLEQCLTTDNRGYVVNNGLEKVVSIACKYTKKSVSKEHSRVSTGILEHMFKHSEGTCEQVVRLGGLDALLLECRKNDLETLRHCASALANLSLYGGAENQVAMIKRKVPMWLFPLAFHNDDNIKYYACLAIAVLVANKEIEAEVLKSGTLNLVEPFVTSHNPSEFAKSNFSHAHGQSQNWLQRLVPVLSSKREEARNLAAFHFCMEAGIKKAQGNTKIFEDIGAVECLKRVASCPNAIASKFAAQALRLIGETVPHKLIQQVPLWSVEDVKQWVKQIGFSEYCDNFEESRVDGDLLLQLTEENLKDDIGIKNGIRRTRFTRELQILKKMADYSSRDADNLNGFLQNIGPEFSVYTYSMLHAGVQKDYLKLLSQDQLSIECGIVNSIHRLRILDAIKSESAFFTNNSQQDSEKLLDVFISYRRSNGSQLASLLKVHLQVRNFSVFIDVEKLEAGKFDNNLLQSIKQASNFILVLTPDALYRCIGDVECKDWVHREIVAALQSNCNIIPITDNFVWPEPEQLPDDMRAICHFNGIKWIHDYQDACVEKLERFIRGEVSSKLVGQDLPTTIPHGNRHARNNADNTSSLCPSNIQRTLSNESTRESDGSGSKE